MLGTEAPSGVPTESNAPSPNTAPDKETEKTGSSDTTTLTSSLLSTEIPSAVSTDWTARPLITVPDQATVNTSSSDSTSLTTIHLSTEAPLVGSTDTYGPATSTLPDIETKTYVSNFNTNMTTMLISTRTPSVVSTKSNAAPTKTATNLETEQSKSSDNKTPTTILLNTESPSVISTDSNATLPNGNDSTDSVNKTKPTSIPSSAETPLVVSTEPNVPPTNTASDQENENTGSSYTTSPYNVLLSTETSSVVTTAPKVQPPNTTPEQDDTTLRYTTKIDWCTQQDICPQRSDCVMKGNTFECICKFGFEMENSLCQDVNECNNNVCMVDSTCNNTVGSYECVCDSGFQFDQGLCIDVDECHVFDVCQTNSICNNNIGSYLCSCQEGFINIAGACQDIDECETYNCQENSVCVNSPGSFHCQCLDGFAFKSPSFCEESCPHFISRCLDIDIDECSTLTCSERETCRNLPGSFVCDCEPGFYRSSNQCEEVSVYSCSVHMVAMNGSEVHFENLSEDQIIYSTTVVGAAMSNYVASLGLPLYGLKVTVVTSGSLLVNLTVFFPANHTYDTENTTNLLMSNLSFWTQFDMDVTYIIIQDLDECSDPALNECSEFAVCENLPGSYTCQCQPGYLDISTFRPGRLCADPIHGLKISQSYVAIPAGTMATWVVTMVRGSHVTYRVQYGDGQAWTHTAMEMLAFQHPLQLEHNYMMAGNYTVTITVTNRESEATVSTYIIVEKVLTSLTLDVLHPDPLYTGEVRFEVRSYSTFNNLHLQWTFGDGDLTHYDLDEISEYVPTYVEHSFPVGKYEVKVNVSNVISWMLLEHEITSDEKISGVSVMVGKQAIKPGDYLNLSVNTTTGSSIVIELNYGNGRQDVIDKNNKVRGFTNSMFFILYDSPGIFYLNITLRNSISLIYKSVGPIYVEHPLKRVQVSVAPVTASPPGVISTTVAYKADSSPPTAVICEALVADTWTNTADVAQLEKDHPLTVDVRIDESLFGWVDIFVNCSNHVSFLTFETGTFVQAVVTDVKVETDKSYLEVGDALHVSFTIGKASYAEYYYNFGFGQNKTGQFLLELIENKTILDTVVYAHPGEYKLEFFVWNAVSSQKALRTIWILEEISGVNMSRFYQQSATVGVFNFGHGDLGNIFPLQRPVIFKIKTSTGNKLQYKLEFNDGNTTVTSASQIEHNFQYEGMYTVTLTVYNELYSRQRSVDIEMYEIVYPHKLNNNGPLKAYTTMVFTLYMSYKGTRSCYLWDVTGSRTLYGGDYCLGHIHSQNGIKFISSSVSDGMHHQHMFTSEGMFSVSVFIFNEVSSANISSIAIVRGVSCFYPKVNIIGGKNTVNLPLKRLVSELIVTSSTAVINCESSNAAVYDWHVYKVVPGETYLDYLLKPYNISIAKTDKLKIYFQPRSFDPGVYKITLNVSMKGIPGLFSDDYTFLQVSPSPLVAAIKGGSARSVSYSKVIKIDGMSMSSDPDNPVGSKAHLQYEWWCRQEHEQFDETSPITIYIPSIEERKNSSDDSLGGCFGTGVGKINVTSGSFEISTLLLNPTSVNVFRLVVIDKERRSMFEQHVHVVEGDPPQVLIRCMVNCKVKMNPSSEFSLLAVCETCHYWDTIDFHWSLYLHDHHDNVLKHDLENITSTDLVSAGLALVGGVLKGGRRYHLRLDVKVHGYTATFTEYAFITNLPPYGGNCSIEPLSGYALSTVFEISCRGWLNPGEEQFRGEGLLYQFWTRVRGGSDTQLLYYGTDPFTAPSKFPLGRKEMEYAHDIVVRISNAIGEYVETTLESKVLPKPQHDLAEVRSLAEDRSGPLFTMKEAGQDQEYKQLIVAMASVLNNKDSGEDIPSVVTSTSETPNIDVDDNEDAVETQGLEDVEKQKNIVIRSTIVEHLSGTDHVTLDALQQTALCFKVITVQTDELTADTQSQAMTAITKMSGEFETIMSEPSKLQSTDQVILAAKGALDSS
ncbi:AGRE1-like protein [Mya arenaria]|uniref:AGRE1-like protein n=1 Tax=Mya arenaria TaxID=6604 RepID=A0ABY7DGK5_MYAAR|nr:AGRE1-like protein [Mya arenaria]